MMKRNEIMKRMELELGSITYWSLSEISDESLGMCLSCGEFDEGYEPDARRCECPACGQFEVYGIEEVIMMIA